MKEGVNGRMTENTAVILKLSNPSKNSTKETKGNFESKRSAYYILVLEIKHDTY